MKTNEEMGAEAALVARKVILVEAERVKLSTRRVLQRISDGLDATENKVFYDKDRGECVVGPDQINWTARQKAADQGIVVLDLKPPDKAKVDMNIKGDLKINVIDRFESGGKPVDNSRTTGK